MEYLDVIIAAAALLGLIGLAWLGGYETGEAAGIERERALGDRRVRGLLDELNRYKPRLQYIKRDLRRASK